MQRAHKKKGSYCNPKGPKIDKEDQDRPPGLKFASGIENVKRAHPPKPNLLWGIPSEIYFFQRFGPLGNHQKIVPKTRVACNHIDNRGTLTWLLGESTFWVGGGPLYFPCDRLRVDPPPLLYTPLP